MKTVLPPEFVDRLRAIVPAERYDEIIRSFTLPRAVGFRVNTLLGQAEPVLESLRADGLNPQSVSWKPDAFWLPAQYRAAVLSSPSHQNQSIYVQNLSSMIPPVVLDARPGERVLDLTASPGSKTLQIACDMKGEGEIAAVEVVRSRFFRMRENLKRQGAHMVRTYLQNGERVWRYRPQYFDRVLLDAPCSTEGRFSLADPDTIAYWTPGKIAEMANKQRRLIVSGIRALRPGGRLVYSTCAFAPEENEATIAHALRTFGDAIEIEPIDLSIENRQRPLSEWNGKAFPADVRNALRILPDEKMEGFFVCAIRKNSSVDAGYSRGRIRAQGT